MVQRRPLPWMRIRFGIRLTLAGCLLAVGIPTGASATFPDLVMSVQTQTAAQTTTQIGAPAWIKPGMRISWTGGQSLRGSRNDSSGGGITQLTVIALTPTSAVVQSEGFGDNGTDVSSAFGATPIRLTAQDNEYWKHPAVLAQMKNSSSDGMTVNRVPFQINKRTYRALTIRKTTKDGGHNDQTFDLASGIMLGQSWEYPHGDGSVTAGYSQYYGQRTMQLPWNINQGPPQWAARALLEYEGQFVIRTPGIDDFPSPLGFSLTYRSAGPNWFAHRKETAGAARGAEELTLSSAAWPGGYWLPSEALRNLRTRSVIDFDPATKMRLSVAATSDRTVSLVATNGNQVSQFDYDLATGVLVSFTTEIARPVNTKQSARLKKLPA